LCGLLVDFVGDLKVNRTATVFPNDHNVYAIQSADESNTPLQFRLMVGEPVEISQGGEARSKLPGHPAPSRPVTPKMFHLASISELGQRVRITSWFRW
jgi:hypothetical protein